MVGLLTIFSMTKIWNEVFFWEAQNDLSLPQPLSCHSVDAAQW
ncbi:Uncharacterised protein [Vibrio cholerae]|nr:Uncharacterised protein [Vibrio cholerae]